MTMNAGLTGSEAKIFIDLMIKANTPQLIKMVKELQDEIEKRNREK